ncbi:dimethylargininase [Phytoactinopolyspora limicola]|uniref:dimethylargininase n=1 Tax=Phytoactinopolyspora limicola TaxID=2715536 RepID=UPI001B7D7632|nr:dimethylargininase [Phytoactinopolyspora limicola]
MTSIDSRHYLMCPPTYFDVTYAINPWMDPARSVDRELAITQWTTLRETYESLGHRVDVIDPIPGLPDMVFTANGAFVVGRRALGARFREPVRAAEAPAHRAWLADRGYEVHLPQAVNEGEGDLAWTGKHILVGTGFRSASDAQAEIAGVFGVPVIALELVDPHFYHLDTALTVLDEHTIAYYPPAFSQASQRQLDALYPEAVIVGEGDAMVLGLNATSDGRHVVMAAQAEKMAEQISSLGFVPVPVDVSELLKAGGGVKCATLELHK